MEDISILTTRYVHTLAAITIHTAKILATLILVQFPRKLHTSLDATSGSAELHRGTFILEVMLNKQVGFN